MTAGVAVARAAERTLTVLGEFLPPVIESAGDETRVSMAGCETSRRPGEPALPVRVLRVLLPPDSDVTAVSARSVGEVGERWVTLPVEHVRAPHPAGGPARPRAASLDEPDPAIYRSDAGYPRAAVELVSVQRWHGYDLALVRVNPVSYRPRAGSLRWSARWEIRLVTATRKTGGPAEQQERASGPALRRHAPPETRSWIEAHVVNPDRDLLAEYAALDVAAGPGPALAFASVGPRVDYLLVTKSNLVAAFQPLLARKAAEGLVVTNLAIEAIQSGQAGRDLPEKIRNAIRFARANWGITYVLLGGDAAVVPCRYAYASMGLLVPDSLVPTDHYYACLDGSWDGNANNVFGEPTDGETGGEIDLLAEVYVGRAPVETAAEAAIFVAKTLRYATETRPRPADVLFLAEYLGDTPSGPSQGWDMLVPMLAYFTNRYRVTALDDAPWAAPRWDGADALAAMNASPHLALFNGHGDTDAMMRIYTEDVDRLTNAHPFLAYSVGCNAGQFDNDKFSPDCIGEELVKRHERGAFGAVLNSRLGWYDPTNEARWSGEFQAQFFRELLTNGNLRLGVANHWSKQRLVGRVERSGLMTYRWCLFEITLFGDPHLAWQEAPTAPPTWTLAVNSDHGDVSPLAGTGIYSAGTSVVCSVAQAAVPGGEGRRYVCTGWTGGGSVPASGVGTTTSFVLGTNSWLRWMWSTQVWVSIATSGNGSVNAASGWREVGATASLLASPAPYHHFANWTGSVPDGAVGSASIAFIVDQPASLTAVFAENRTSTGTPEWWLAAHGWTDDFEAASAADSDGDGLSAWGEWITGTDPRDAESALRVEIRPAGTSSGVVVRWSGVAGRVYSLWRADASSGPFQRVAADLAGPAAGLGMLEWTDAAVGTVHRFYRVEAAMQP